MVSNPAVVAAVSDICTSHRVRSFCERYSLVVFLLKNSTVFQFSFFYTDCKEELLLLLSNNREWTATETEEECGPTCIQEGVFMVVTPPLPPKNFFVVFTSACLNEYLSRNISKLGSSDLKICQKIEKVKYSSKINLQVKILRLSMIFEIKL